MQAQSLVNTAMFVARHPRADLTGAIADLIAHPADDLRAALALVPTGLAELADLCREDGFSAKRTAKMVAQCAAGADLLRAAIPFAELGGVLADDLADDLDAMAALDPQDDDR